MRFVAVVKHGSTRTRRVGVTMVDLVLTVLIIGILAAVATPKFAGSLHRAQADSAAKRIKADLAYARQTAISQSKTISVLFGPASNDYSIPALPNLDRPGQTYSVMLSKPPYNASLVSATLGGDSNVQFDHYGKPDSGGAITVAAGAFQTTVSVDAETGKATIP